MRVRAVSPCANHFDETMSTLKYAERAKRMRTKAVVNEKVSDENLIAQLRHEVHKAQFCKVWAAVGLYSSFDLSILLWLCVDCGACC